MNLGENIRKIRKSKKMTMKQLGEIIGISEQGIGNYERGDREPGIETLTKIAKALEVNLSTLLQGTNYTDLTNLNKKDEDIYLNFLAPDEQYKKYVYAFKEFGYIAVNHAGTYFSGEIKEGFIYNILDKDKNPIITLDLEGFRKLGEKFIQLQQYKQNFDKSLKSMIDNEFSNFKFLYGINETKK